MKRVMNWTRLGGSDARGAETKSQENECESALGIANI